MQEKLDEIRALIDEYNKQSKLHKVTLAHARIYKDGIIDDFVYNYQKKHNKEPSEEEIEKHLENISISAFDHVRISIEDANDEDIYWRSSSLSC